jgi:quercetin dioxygenase-like cupin family protein
MKVIRIENIPEIPRATYKGEIRIKTLVSQEVGARDFKIAIATFPKGARSAFHTHTFDQVHIVLSGKGIIADEKQEVVFTEGMVAFIPAGERHWHGATEDNEFTHLSIMGPDALKTVT